MGYLIEPNVGPLTSKKQFTIPFADFINIASVPYAFDSCNYVLTSAFISVINTAGTAFTNFNHIYISSPNINMYVAYYDEANSAIKNTAITAFLINAKQPPFIGGAVYDNGNSNIYLTASQNPIPDNTVGDVLLSIFYIPISELTI